MNSASMLQTLRDADDAQAAIEDPEIARGEGRLLHDPESAIE